LLDSAQSDLILTPDCNHWNMAGLKKTLLFMLVICTLGYSSAWAYDGHAVELGNDATAAVDMVATGTMLLPLSDHGSEQSQEQTSVADAGCCDHCCHISAHLNAIFTQNGYLCSVNQSSELLEFSEIFISYIVSPDLRPPRV
jgi:hypothetical protein